jgi:hypothetical protein
VHGAARLYNCSAWLNGENIRNRSPAGWYRIGADAALRWTNVSHALRRRDRTKGVPP